MQTITIVSVAIMLSACHITRNPDAKMRASECDPHFVPSQTDADYTRNAQALAWAKRCYDTEAELNAQEEGKRICKLPPGPAQDAAVTEYNKTNNPKMICIDVPGTGT